jgi:hypothetical protein
MVFYDTYAERAANALYSDFIAAQIRARDYDKATAERVFRGVQQAVRPLDRLAGNTNHQNPLRGRRDLGQHAPRAGRPHLRGRLQRRDMGLPDND